MSSIKTYIPNYFFNKWRITEDLLPTVHRRKPRHKVWEKAPDGIDAYAWYEIVRQQISGAVESVRKLWGNMDRINKLETEILAIMSKCN